MAATRVAVLVVAVTILSGMVQAAVVATTEVANYTIGGSTPEAIFKNILKRGPEVSGDQAIASVVARAEQEGRLDSSNGSCRLSDYKVRLTFLITRPRLARPDVLSAKEQAMWKQMDEFIIAHENQHKRIWISCASAIDNHMTAMSAPSCGQLMAKGNYMWKQMLSVCEKNQIAFDRIQSWQLEQLPFMRRARGD